MPETLNQRAPAAQDEGELRLADVANTLLRNRWLVVGVTLAVAALSALYTVSVRPVFQSQATVAIDNDKQSKNPLADVLPISAGMQGKLETELVTLRSWAIAEAVADSLSLQVKLTEPAVPRSQVLRVLTAPRNAPAGRFLLERGGDGSYALTVERGARGVRVPSRVEPGVPFRIGNTELALAPSLVGGGPETVRFEIVTFRKTVDLMRRSMAVTRVDPKANVISITYASVDPELAAAVPNAAAVRYIHYKAEVSKRESRQMVSFLRDQVESYAGQLVGAENQLRGFREQQRVVSPQEEAVQQVQRLAQLQAERERIVAERDALGKLLDRVSQGQRPDNQPTQYRQLASFPVFLANKAVQDLLQSLTTLENQRADLLVRRTDQNVDVRGVEQRIRDMELQLYEIARNYKEGLDSQIASADANLGRFGSQLELIPAREVEFARLSRQEKLLSEIYTLLQTRLKESEIREAAEPDEVRIIDSALVPLEPISPRPVRNVALGLLAGLVLATAAAFGRQATETRIRTKEDVAAATGSMPILGVIPRFPAPQGARRIRGKRFEMDDAPARVMVRAEPLSPVAEAFRALRTNILFSSVDGAPKVVVLTSAMPGEGKSTTSANLAVTLAQQGGRTLLVDSDLRRATLHTLFSTDKEPGLTHVLLGMSTLDDVIHTVEVAPGCTLDFLPAGISPPNPAEVLGSPQMQRLIAEVRTRYDNVLFDAPPLNLVTDAAILAKSVDGTLLVTRNGFTDKRALHHAAGQLQQVRAHVTGVVLNDVDASGDRYYGYGSYGSYAPVGNGTGNGANGTNGKGKQQVRAGKSG